MHIVQAPMEGTGGTDGGDWGNRWRGLGEAMEGTGGTHGGDRAAVIAICVVLLQSDDTGPSADQLSESKLWGGQDLIQIKGREQWYTAKFIADDAPDWNAASWLRSSIAVQGVREVVLDVEISRERVPLRNGYVRIGQKAQVRVNGGLTYELPGMPRPAPSLAVCALCDLLSLQILV